MMLRVSDLNPLAVDHSQRSSTGAAVLLAQLPAQPGGGQVETPLLELEPPWWTLVADVTWRETDGGDSELLFLMLLKKNHFLL